MSDADQVNQAIAELWDIVKCRCHEAYTGRGLHDPDCQCDSTDAVKTVADRIEALTEQRDAARQDAKEAEAYAEELEAKLSICEKYRDAYAEMGRIGTQAVRDLEAKLAKAVEALRFYAWENEMRLPSDGPWGAGSTDFGKVARATLAEIKGENHE